MTEVRRLLVVLLGLVAVVLAIFAMSNQGDAYVELAGAATAAGIAILIFAL